MGNSYFFIQPSIKKTENSVVLGQLERFANDNNKQIYVINKPLGDNKYSYQYEDAFVLLSPKQKIIFINLGNEEENFQSYIDDFIEDLGSISDKYRYKQFIGRPRSWSDLYTNIQYENNFDINNLIARSKIEREDRQKVCELLISLLTGCINDIEKVKADVPDNLLDKVKQKILLFDGDQTRFIYQKPQKNTIRIQGLSGTGKTELLLHKLKELYVDTDDSRIIFTCHNKILADNLKKRIPEFFNFMKVEKQIKWQERLWCVHAWGSQNDINSGTYRFICEYYGVQFHRFSYFMSFEKACGLALEQIKNQVGEQSNFAFDYMLIDESQDFPVSFFDLCEFTTRNTVYIAGDIFQSIFDENIISTIEPDFLLSKCYRTDPKTLMFAHSLGMGLFESNKLRWLEDKEWLACGYLVEHDGNICRLKREPLRRFEDLDLEDFESTEIIEINDNYEADSVGKVIDILQRIVNDNPTVKPDDIGVIFIENDKRNYQIADRLEIEVPRKFKWGVNKAYESKSKRENTLFISNKNNVKGLEFPFVICISDRIGRSYGLRNSLYMILTRSFIKTYLLISVNNNKSLMESLKIGLNKIIKSGYIEIIEPSDPEKEKIKTTINFTDSSMSFYDFILKIFDELLIEGQYREKLFDIVKDVNGEDFDYENAKETIEFNYKKMKGKSN